MPADLSAFQANPQEGTREAPQEPVVLPVVAATPEDAEVLQASIRAGSVAQIMVAIIAAIGLMYLLKIVLITTLGSVLLAFALEPAVAGLGRLRVPRWAGSLIAVLLLMALLAGLSYFFYNRAIAFADQLPRYSGEIHRIFGRVLNETAKLEQSTRAVTQPQHAPKPVPVEVQGSTGVTNIFTSGAYTEKALAVSFVPFLIYFMLMLKEHVRSATVRLFPKEHRIVAHRTVGRISEMIRSFIVGNLIIGLVNSAVSVAVFGALHLPYFYFLGVISGFVSLIPYLGIFVAMLPPLAGGIGVLKLTGMLIIIATTVGLHLVSMNVLYPKIVGGRLQLNPLAVTLALLFWSWLWGAMGLVLAVPMLGATKVICDYVEPLQPLGNWLGE